mmetsp:Transcript_31425/g.65721  ORF Transcript_31425/g.65721 Transcript_31425/m.65721 type:complete len:86 (-) Transcript_31425:949-1206(-)
MVPHAISMVAPTASSLAFNSSASSFLIPFLMTVWYGDENGNEWNEVCVCVCVLDRETKRYGWQSVKNQDRQLQNAIDKTTSSRQV